MFRQYKNVPSKVYKFFRETEEDNHLFLSVLNTPFNCFCVENHKGVVGVFIQIKSTLYISNGSYPDIPRLVRNNERLFKKIKCIIGPAKPVGILSEFLMETYPSTFVKKSSVSMWNYLIMPSTLNKKFLDLGGDKKFIFNRKDTIQLYSKVISDFTVKFGRETGISSTKKEDKELVRIMTERNPKDISLLLHEDGRVLSMACITGKSDTSVRLGYVYTDINHRGNHYSRYLVASMVHRILERKKIKFVCCYADVTVAGSNKVYKSVGFKRKELITVFQFQ
jgi:hypothetical protein